jgi:hypothetical protein
VYINLPRPSHDLNFSSTNKAPAGSSNIILQQPPALIEFIAMLAILSIAALAITALATQFQMNVRSWELSLELLHSLHQIPQDWKRVKFLSEISPIVILVAHKAALRNSFQTT